MCDAVVVPVRPVKLIFTINTCVARLRVTVPEPLPGEALGGFSFGPLAKKVNVCAWALAARNNAAMRAADRLVKFMGRSFRLELFRRFTGSNQILHDKNSNSSVTFLPSCRFSGKTNCPGRADTAA